VPVSIGTIILLSCPYIKDMLFILWTLSQFWQIELWHELKSLQNQAIENQIKDCYAIMLKMKEENAFCFTVTVTIINPQTLRLVTPSLFSSCVSLSFVTFFSRFFFGYSIKLILFEIF
jgi:hypothetical protein